MADAALERQVSGRQASGRQVSGAYRGLRGWLDMVERLGELKRVSGAHWDVEMGAVTHMLTEKSGGMAPAILFDDVPGYRKGYRTLYGQLSSVKRIALTLGLPLEHERKVDIVQRYHARMQDLKPLPPRYVNDGPIFENVIEGDTVDVLKFPVPRHHEQDKARFIGTADCVVTKDPTAVGTISAPIAVRFTTARPSAARSPRASMAASTATNISRVARR